MSIDIRVGKSFRDCFPDPVANRRDLVKWVAEIVYPMNSDSELRSAG